MQHYICVSLLLIITSYIYIFSSETETILLTDNYMFLVLRWLQHILLSESALCHCKSWRFCFVCDWEILNTIIVRMRRGELEPNESHYSHIYIYQESCCKTRTICEVNTS